MGCGKANEETGFGRGSSALCLPLPCIPASSGMSEHFEGEVEDLLQQDQGSSEGISPELDKVVGISVRPHPQEQQTGQFFHVHSPPVFRSPLEGSGYPAPAHISAPRRGIPSPPILLHPLQRGRSRNWLTCGEIISLVEGGGGHWQSVPDCWCLGDGSLLYCTGGLPGSVHLSRRTHPNSRPFLIK